MRITPPYGPAWSTLHRTPPPQAGTAFYQHNETGFDLYPDDESQRASCDADATAWERWTVTDRIANRFNRLILFRGRRFHASQGHFGDCKENGRLFQTFFFNTHF